MGLFNKKKKVPRTPAEKVKAFLAEVKPWSADCNMDWREGQVVVHLSKEFLPGTAMSTLLFWMENVLTTEDDITVTVETLVDHPQRFNLRKKDPESPGLLKAVAQVIARPLVTKVEISVTVFPTLYFSNEIYGEDLAKHVRKLELEQHERDEQRRMEKSERQRQAMSAPLEYPEPGAPTWPPTTVTW